MMSDTEEISVTLASVNPFDESEEIVEEPKTEVTAPASTNPFESEEVENDTFRNPFEGDKEDYNNIPLDVPSIGAKTHNRDWDLEWEHVSSAVKKNFSSISVVAPELISSMMSK